MRELVRQALAALGIERFLLAVHGASLPGDPADDIGHGSPLSNGGRAFLKFAAHLGFDGLQLGPQGETTAYNPSPYDATLFSRNTMSLSLSRMVEDGLLARSFFERAVAGRPPNALHRAAHDYAETIVGEALKSAARPTGFDAFWLHRYRLNEAEIFGQWVAHEQHRRFREEARALGLVLIGDLQVGISRRDAQAFPELLLPELSMGAPPSRTNPEGQAWNYAVLEPQGAVHFVEARAKRLFEDYDGLRVDHPHGFIDPWVYRTDVQRGARLFSSPEAFPQWSIAREDQIDRSQSPHADAWVRELSSEQVDRYARQFDVLAAEPKKLIVEILSTQPYPVRRVLERHGLGQFRVTQKADPLDGNDVYRSANARPQDWIMTGTHDTEPIWRVTERWGAAHADYLSSRLRTCVAVEPASLAVAQLADLFLGPAQNVMIFFADLLGLREVYNRPGTVSRENWTLRVPPDFEQRAAHLPAALVLALRARGHDTLAKALQNGG